ASLRIASLRIASLRIASLRFVSLRLAYRFCCIGAAGTNGSSEKNGTPTPDNGYMIAYFYFNLGIGRHSPEIRP
ncbi:MAG: hypothetical protein II940_01780, partial [Methanosarcinaceae archaeon]|nr:hypothetical protein [Methanosarcinaceae archaeon]